MGETSRPPFNFLKDTGVSGNCHPLPGHAPREKDAPPGDAWHVSRG
ncbi:hypothetical protein ASZ90_002253 [hydrocarbon metagenome]|uniref:Uncharacterized protein n=1 Tax=hydrocarbon metagenome TaxID=938273 RepID=A0A0W8G463_9ZZZZ